MVNTSFENYENAIAYTIKIGNRELIWVRMINF